MIRSTSLFAALLLLAGCTTAPSPAPEDQPGPGSSPEALIRRMETNLATTLLDDAIDTLAATYPEFATRLGRSRSDWNRPGETALTSPELMELADRAMTAVDRSQIPPRLGHDIEHLAFGARVAGALRSAGIPSAIDMVNGPHVRLPRFLVTHQPLGSATDVSDFRSRLRKIDNYTSALIARDAPLRVTGGDVIAHQCNRLLDELASADGGIILEDFAARTWHAGLDTHIDLAAVRREADAAIRASCSAVTTIAARQTSDIRTTSAR